MMGNLGMGTGFKFSGFPFRQVIGGKAICPDGKVRTLARIGEPDTVWTRPAAVRVGGMYVRGFVSIETAQGMDAACAVDGDPAVLKFTADAKVRDLVFPGKPATWHAPKTEA